MLCLIQALHSLSFFAILHTNQLSLAPVTKSVIQLSFPSSLRFFSKFFKLFLNLGNLGNYANLIHVLAIFTLSFK
jgi:hypothetical protein